MCPGYQELARQLQGLPKVMENDSRTTKDLTLQPDDAIDVWPNTLCRNNFLHELTSASCSCISLSPEQTQLKFLSKLFIE